MSTIKSILLCGALIIPMGKLSHASALRLVRHGLDFVFPNINTSLKNSDPSYFLYNLRKARKGVVDELDAMQRAASESAPGIDRKRNEEIVTHHTIKLQALNEYIENFSKKVAKLLDEGADPVADATQ